MLHLQMITKPGNVHGRDLISTDPHGSLAALRELMQLLQPHDRLFLCGDLIDRDIENSYALLRYLDDEIRLGKEICLIRGNHEDMLLQTLEFLDVIAAMNARVESAPEGEDVWEEFIAAHPLYYGLDNLRVSQCIDILYVFKAFCEDFQNKTNGSVSLTRDDISGYAVVIKEISLVDSRMCEAFYGFAAHLFDGGAWVLDLNGEQRHWVRDFIEPWPYMIRVAAVQQGDRCIATFDIVHAAPLSEAEIEQVLQGGSLSRDQIHYITWARPAEKFQKGDTSMLEMGRTPMTPRVYVGHNTLSAHDPIYQAINVFALDAATFVTGALFVANHTDSLIYSVETVGLTAPISCVVLDKKQRSLQALKDLAESAPSFEVKQSAGCDMYSAVGVGVGRGIAFYSSDFDADVQGELSLAVEINPEDIADLLDFCSKLTPRCPPLS